MSNRWRGWLPDLRAVRGRYRISPRGGRHRSQAPGFTLIELLLYVGIASIIVATISGFLAILIESRAKSQAVAEVEQQGMSVMQIMTQAVRNATTINYPRAGEVSDHLSLDAEFPSYSSAVFRLEDGQLVLVNGSDPVKVLTNERVSVIDISFTNLGSADALDTVRIGLTINYRNPSGRQEYDWQKTFYSTAVRRQP